MNILKDGFQVFRVPKEEIDGLIAPIYILGLPGDVDKFKKQIDGNED